MDAYEWLKGLSFPRLMGTEGEEKAIKYIEKGINDIGLRSKIETFKWSFSMFIILKIIFSIVIASMLIIDIVFGKIAILSLSVAILTVFIIIMIAKKIFGGGLPMVGKKYVGKNILCEIDPKSEIKGEIFLSAHYDTKSSRIKSWKKLTAGSLLGTFIFYLIVIISSIFRLIDHNSIVADILDIIYLLISFLVVPVLIILLYNKLINESPGACDNGSGVAIILKLAEIYNQEKLKNSKITVIFTGAEEVGMFGMKKYMKDHRDHLDEIKNHWYQINIDMVGSEIGYFNSKSEKIPENKVLNNLIKEIAEEKNIKLNPFFASMLSGEEHEPFLKAGFETCDFTSHADIPNIHSAKDTMEKVNPEKLNQAIELIKEMIKRIDSKYILESLNLEK